MALVEVYCFLDNILLSNRQRQYVAMIRGYVVTSTNQLKRDVSELQKVVERRISLLGTKRNDYGKAFYTHYHKRHLLAFARFIDNPHCYNNQLHDLYYCQSEIGGLQQRQRIACVKVMTALFCRLEMESLQLGFCRHAYMEPLTHKAIRRLYHRCWGEAISEKRYYATLKILKMADFFVVDAVYVQDVDVIANPDAFNDGDITRVYSKPAYKSITQKFMAIFDLAELDDVKKSYFRGISKRIRSGLSNTWVMYEAFSYSYFWKKRNKPILKRNGQLTYPQGRSITPSLYDGNYHVAY